MNELDLEVIALKSIVGSASVDVSGTLTILDGAGLQPDDFSKPGCQAIAAAIIANLRDGRQPDAVNLLQLTRGNASRDLVIDIATNAQFLNVQQRVEMVRESGQRRKMLDALRAIAMGVKSANVPLATAVADSQKLLSSFTGATGTVRTQEQSLMEFIDKLDQVQRGIREPITTTGIDLLDFFIAGWQRTLTIIGALPGVGKSALIAKACFLLAKRGIKCGLISLEDEREWLTRRVLSEASDVPLFLLGKRPLTPAQMQRMDAAAPSVFDALRNIVVEDTPGMNTTQVVACARQMVAMGCKAIFVDHLGEIRLERTDRHDLDIADALQQLRVIAKAYGVPVIVASHLRRREGLGIDSPPKLSDFAFSAAVERMARVALGLYRDGPDLGVALLKQTEGPSGMTFALNMNKMAGMVAQTGVSAATREEFKWMEQ